MLRAVVSKRVIDRLIREKLQEACGGRVFALPVVWRRPVAMECNWEIPGWTGDDEALADCRALVEPYVRFLEGQFDIRDEA